MATNEIPLKVNPIVVEHYGLFKESISENEMLAYSDYKWRYYFHNAAHGFVNHRVNNLVEYHMAKYRKK